MASDTQSKKAQREIKQSAQKIWLAGLGALAVAEQEGARMFDTLVERGRSWEGRGKERMGEARAKVEHAVDDVEERVDSRVAAALRRFGVPTRDEIHELTRRVEELNAKLETLNLRPRKAPQGSPAGAKAKAPRPKGTPGTGNA
ncbi:MAG TPA: phasin family protein [Thermoanaerobaculia bacterium]|nr:phasin family protein [Thermoanaerobaculia bacterium]